MLTSRCRGRSSSDRAAGRGLPGAPLRRDATHHRRHSVSRAQAQAFTERQIALLETFADQAVIAIENARLFQELQRAHRPAFAVGRRAARPRRGRPGRLVLARPADGADDDRDQRRPALRRRRRRPLRVRRRRGRASSCGPATRRRTTWWPPCGQTAASGSARASWGGLALVARPVRSRRRR